MSSTNPQNHFASYFQPIQSDCFANQPSNELVNMSIFRHQDQGDISPMMVCRANPISTMEGSDDECDEHFSEPVDDTISPYPLSPCKEELEHRDHLRHQIHFSWNEKTAEAIDYSFYFEPLPDQMEDTSICDDVSLEDLYTNNSSSFWEDGVAQSFCPQPDSLAIQSLRTYSPAQVSIGSDIEHNESPSE